MIPLHRKLPGEIESKKDKENLAAGVLLIGWAIAAIVALLGGVILACVLWGWAGFAYSLFALAFIVFVGALFVAKLMLPKKAEKDGGEP